MVTSISPTSFVTLHGIFIQTNVFPQPRDIFQLGRGTRCKPREEGGGPYFRCWLLYYQRFKAESKVQTGKPKGALESEIRIAMLLLEQRPPCQTYFLREKSGFSWFYCKCREAT